MIDENVNYLLDHYITDVYADVAYKELTVGDLIAEFAFDKSDKVRRALVVAAVSHLFQFRKYTNNTVPYIVHPIEVAILLSLHTNDEDMICAALLHDVVEDCDVSIHQVKDAFGVDVASYVNGLTDVSEESDGKRPVRKATDRIHTSRQSNKTKTIKLCDLINNSESILAADSGFAKVYMNEKRLLLDEALVGGDSELWKKADVIVKEYFESKSSDGSFRPTKKRLGEICSASVDALLREDE